MSNGKSHYQRSSKREFKGSAQVFNGASAGESKPIEQAKNVIGYRASFIAPPIKEHRYLDEFDITEKGDVSPRANPGFVDARHGSEKVFFYCLQHKPSVGHKGCQRVMGIDADINLFTYVERVCREPDCGKAVLPMKSLFLAIAVSQKLGSVISSELKDDLCNAVDQDRLPKDKSDRLENTESVQELHTISFGWSKQFELVQFLFDWKAELLVDKGVPKIIATSFRQSKLGLDSFSPLFLIRIAKEKNAHGYYPRRELDAGDIADLGCHFDEDLQSYARKFSSVAALIDFLRQFGGILHVELAGRGQKQPALPIITLSGGNW